MSIIFDVRGTKIKVDKEKLLKSQVEGTLRDLIENAKDPGIEKDVVSELYVDENPIFFHAMLDYYQNGYLERPIMIPEKVWELKCKYWCIENPKPQKVYVQQEFMDYFMRPFSKIKINYVNTNFTSLLDYGFKQYIIGFDRNKLIFFFGIDTIHKTVAFCDTSDLYSIFCRPSCPKSLEELLLDHDNKLYTKEDKPKVLKYFEQHIVNRDLELEQAFFAQFE